MVEEPQEVGPAERVRYYVGVRGKLDSYIARTSQDEAQRRRNELLATAEFTPREVIVFRAPSLLHAVRTAEQWHAQCLAEDTAEQDGDA